MRTFIHRPVRGSASGMMLARDLGVPAIRRRGSRYRPRPGDLLINWGCSTPRFQEPDDEIEWLNRPEAVRRAIDKRTAWDMWGAAEVPTVEYTEDPDTAVKWLANGDRLLVRTTLRGSQGRGITAYSQCGTSWTAPWEEYVPEPGDTYVKVFGRNPQLVDEYRVHVMQGEIVDYVQKKRRLEYEGRPHPYIRSYTNGWIFARDGVHCPQLALRASIEAVETIGLDFGAVDIGVRSRDGGFPRACVYEVNTAPGLQGTTRTAWAARIRRHMGEGHKG